MIAVSLKGAVLYEIKCADQYFPKFGFRCWLNFTHKVCVRFWLSLEVPFSGDGCIGRIMCEFVVLVYSLINEDDCWVIIVCLVTAAMVELLRFRSSSQCCDALVHLFVFITLLCPGIHVTWAPVTVFSAPSCGTCKELSFSGFDLLWRIPLGGEWARSSL